MRFNELQIDRLREQICEKLSDFRLDHTLGVEKMAIRLGEIYCPEKIDVLRVAALLHDVTKELSVAEHTEIYRSHALEPSREELSAPATLHSVTAALIIPEKYPEFASDEVIGAVKYHTVGRENMTLTEKLIFLADYIDETRKYEDCIALRQEFFDSEPEKMTESEKVKHLDRVILHAFDLTIADLLKNRRVLSVETVSARNSIIYSLNENK